LAPHPFPSPPPQARKRTKLALPAPQVSDAELAEIAKGGALAVDMGIEDESSATKALVGVYGVTPMVGAAPARTPRVPASQDVIMEEARNILALNSVGTPLKGGQNVAIVGGTGFMGAQPISRTVSTPNPMASAGTPMGTPGATPLMRGGTGLLPAGTPLRDELRINADASAALVLTGSGSVRGTSPGAGGGRGGKGEIQHGVCGGFGGRGRGVTRQPEHRVLVCVVCVWGMECVCVVSALSMIPFAPVHA
jgi:hypothetical protein